MSRFHVTVAARMLETYEVEATDPVEASDRWFEGRFLFCDDEALETEVLSVKEVRP